MNGKELGLWQILVFGAAGLLTFLGGWELLARTGVIDPFFLPAPSPVLDRMTRLAGGPEAVLWQDIQMSTSRVLTGFALSALVGMPVGLIMGMSAAARNLGANRLQVIRHVVLPGALPNILSGLKVVLAIAWTCVISAEMVGANSGLGFRIWTAKEWSDTGQVLVGMLCISITVLLLDILFRGLERVLLPWQRKGAR